MKEDLIKRKFNSDLDSIYECVSKITQIMTRNFNTKIDKEKVFKYEFDQESFHQTSNDNYGLLCHL